MPTHLTRIAAALTFVVLACVGCGDYLVRPYPRAVAGQPLDYGFDEETDEFTLTFESRAKVGGLTEIFVPTARYPDGWHVEVSDPDGSWSSTWDEAAQVLSVETDPTLESHTITIRGGV